jgi:hypothetical protein
LDRSSRNDADRLVESELQTFAGLPDRSDVFDDRLRPEFTTPGEEEGPNSLGWWGDS